MKLFISLFLLASTLFLAAQAPPVLRQKYTTNTASAVDAVVNGLITAAIGDTTGTGADVKSNTPVIFSPTFKGTVSGSNGVTLGFANTDAQMILTGKLYIDGWSRLSGLTNFGFFYQSSPSTFEDNVALNGADVTQSIGNLSTLGSTTVAGKFTAKSNFQFTTYQNSPTSDLTNYAIPQVAETWINATNKVNFSSMFLMGGSDVLVCNVTVTNFTGTNQPISFVGPANVSWLSDIPSVVTNGTGGILATKHCSNRVFAVWAWQKSSQ